MPTTKDYADFIQDQFSGLDGISLRKMFGEYVVKLRGRTLGFLIDNELLIQNVQTACRLLPDARKKPLFPGSKDFIVMPDVDSSRFLKEIAEAVYEELPVSKPRKSRHSGKEGDQGSGSSKSRTAGKRGYRAGHASAVRGAAFGDVAGGAEHDSNSGGGEMSGSLDPEISSFMDFYRRKCR